MPTSTRIRLLRTLTAVDDERRRTAAVQGELNRHASEITGLKTANADLRRQLDAVSPQLADLNEQLRAAHAQLSIATNQLAGYREAAQLAQPEAAAPESKPKKATAKKKASA